jgi:hypothetical protein
MIAFLLIVWMSCEYPHHDTGCPMRCVITLPGAGAIVPTVRCVSSRLILFEETRNRRGWPSRSLEQRKLGLQANIGTTPMSPWIEFAVGLPAVAVVVTLLTLWIVAVDRGYL